MPRLLVVVVALFFLLFSGVNVFATSIVLKKGESKTIVWVTKKTSRCVAKVTAKNVEVGYESAFYSPHYPTWAFLITLIPDVDFDSVHSNSYKGVLKFDQSGQTQELGMYDTLFDFDKPPLLRYSLTIKNNGLNPVKVNWDKCKN